MQRQDRDEILRNGDQVNRELNRMDADRLKVANHRLGIPRVRLTEDLATKEIANLAASTRVIMSDTLKIDMIKFIQQKLSDPNYEAVYRALFGSVVCQKIIEGKLPTYEIDIVCAKFAHRLLHNRPLVFTGPDDDILLRPDRDINWVIAVLRSKITEQLLVDPHNVGLKDMLASIDAYVDKKASVTKADGSEDYRYKQAVKDELNILRLAEKYPEILAEYISYSEIEIGRRLAVSGLSHLYQYDESADSAVLGSFKYKKSSSEPALIHGSVGVRFERVDTPEYKAMIRTHAQIGAMSDSEKSKFVCIDDKNMMYVDKELYKQAMREVYLNYLADANAHAGAQGKKAYVQLNFYGLSSWIHKIPGCTEDKTLREQVFSGLQAEVLQAIFTNELPQMKNIGAIEINDRNKLLYRGIENHVMPTGVELITRTNATPGAFTEALPSKYKSYLRCVNNSWDAASCHGNELYIGAAAKGGSLDSRIGFFTNTAFTFNPLINTAVFGVRRIFSNILTVSKEGNVAGLAREPLSIVNEFGGTELSEAAIKGDDKKLGKLLDKHRKHPFNLDQPDAKGNTALAWAIYNDQKQCVIMLLQAGANPDVYAINKDGSPAGQTLRELIEARAKADPSWNSLITELAVIAPRVVDISRPSVTSASAYSGAAAAASASVAGSSDVRILDALAEIRREEADSIIPRDAAAGRARADAGAGAARAGIFGNRAGSKPEQPKSGNEQSPRSPRNK